MFGGTQLDVVDVFWIYEAGSGVLFCLLRKYADGKMEWTEIEDLKKLVDPRLRLGLDTCMITHGVSSGQESFGSICHEIP